MNIGFSGITVVACEKMSPHTDYFSLNQEIRRTTVDVKCHIAGPVTNFSIWMAQYFKIFRAVAVLPP